MTLEDLITLYRPHLEDETVGFRRSWEETFRYGLKFYPKATPLAEFDVEGFADMLVSSGIDAKYARGYATRWRDLIARADELQAISRAPADRSSQSGS